MKQRWSLLSTLGFVLCISMFLLFPATIVGTAPGIRNWCRQVLSGLWNAVITEPVILLLALAVMVAALFWIWIFWPIGWCLFSAGRKDRKQ